MRELVVVNAVVVVAAAVAATLTAVAFTAFTAFTYSTVASVAAVGAAAPSGRLLGPAALVASTWVTVLAGPLLRSRFAAAAAVVAASPGPGRAVANVFGAALRDKGCGAAAVLEFKGHLSHSCGGHQGGPAQPQSGRSGRRGGGGGGGGGGEEE